MTITKLVVVVVITVIVVASHSVRGEYYTAIPAIL